MSPLFNFLCIYIKNKIKYAVLRYAKNNYLENQYLCIYLKFAFYIMSKFVASKDIFIIFFRKYSIIYSSLNKIKFLSSERFYYINKRVNMNEMCIFIGL